MKRFIRRILIASSLIAIFCAVGWLALPKPPLLDGIPFSTEVFSTDGDLLRITLTPDSKYRVRTPLTAISPNLVNATLSYEDQHYERLPGVNPVALLRSAWNLCAHGHSRSGASTITMQVARLRFGLYTKTIPGKLRQILCALELERHYTKDEILDAYFNLAPYGHNIEGAAAASAIYFGKPAAALTMPEAVSLTVIPQSPTRRALKIGAINTNGEIARERLLERLLKDEDADSQAGFAISDLRDFEPKAIGRVPFLAPHFTRAVLAAHPHETTIRTTLDLDFQKLIERKITQYVANRERSGVHNAAAMLVDFRTMNVLAQVGSADFFNNAIFGQVDGTRSLRSPGSTLKPFIYALAMQQGVIHPQSILADTPHNFGAYAPENYDRQFVGPIDATDALIRSRNVPAVWLCSQLKHPGLYEFLKSANCQLPNDQPAYGLSLTLGGGEVRMSKLVELYAMLANNGLLQPLRRVSSDKPVTPRRLLSVEASWLTLDMLGKNPRPDTEEPDARLVFWKTGTSNGFHDAWSIAVFDHYVLAVWIGNFDGRSNPAFIGRTCAAPLLFQIIDALRLRYPSPANRHLPPPGANLRRMEFCADSGDLTNPDCPHHKPGWFIPGVSPIKTCDVHRAIWVDQKTGLRVLNKGDTPTTRREVYEFWPADLLTLFKEAGLPRRVPPPFLGSEGIDAISRSGRAPFILSPRANARYVLTTAHHTLTLLANGDPAVQKIYWFADKRFIGTSKPGEALFWKADFGCRQITALDDRGNSGTHAISLVWNK